MSKDAIKTSENTKLKAKNVVKVPPDGGWGWMVCAGQALNSVFMIPIIQNFGLIYKDRLQELEFSSTDITTLTSLNSWFGMILGIFSAPLLKRFGYRKMSIVGVGLFTVGTLLSAFANSYLHFIVSYGMLSSLGMIYSMSSFSLAMSTYFKKKRSFASSRVMTVSGLGPIFMPLLISKLLAELGTKWTVLLLAAITANGFVGAMLLQPVKWYMKTVEASEQGDEEDEDDIVAEVYSHMGSDLYIYDRSGAGSRRTSLTSYKQPTYQRACSTEKYPNMGSMTLSKSRTSWEASCNWMGATHSNRNSVSIMDNEDYTNILGSTLYILEKAESKKKPTYLASMESLDEKSKYARTVSENNKLVEADEEELQEEEEKEEEPIQQSAPVVKVRKPWYKRFAKSIVKMYDLDLLKDPVYLNLTVGMGVAIIGELTFSIMTPFILFDMGLNNDQIAIFAACIAIADLVFRFLAPYFGKWISYSSRKMYLMALFLLLVTRLGLFLTTDFTGLLVVAVTLGIGKGFRTVYWVLVVPDYVPLEKLASASAFQNLSTGVFLAFTGPLMGLIVGINNQYSNLIYASNVMTATTIVLWLIEFVVVYFRNKKTKNNAS